MNASVDHRLRIGIVGAGYVARYHIEALKRLDYVEIIGICDLDREAAGKPAPAERGQTFLYSWLPSCLKRSACSARPWATSASMWSKA